MELEQSSKIEQNLPFLYLILANCPLFSLNSCTNSELIHIEAPSTAALAALKSQVIHEKFTFLIILFSGGGEGLLD